MFRTSGAVPMHTSLESRLAAQTEIVWRSRCFPKGSYLGLKGIAICTIMVLEPFGLVFMGQGLSGSFC